MKIGAVLLAGGESRRMGTDKATVRFRGEPLWRRQLDLLRSLGPVEIMISARMKPKWQPSGTTFVRDHPPSRGPLSGLGAALQIMRGTHLLALAVDMPLMSRLCLISLCDRIAPGRGVLPKIGARAEPLAAVYPRECLPYVDAAVAENDFSLQSLTQSLVEFGLLRLIEVPAAEEQLYRSLNTPADICELEPIYEGPVSAKS